ncbi:MAG: Lrp/AsnC ligand binding domain-containing protein [Planctomycetes bacterium]|nr:Lrp/AsnC ligand binding domain-containing protein [Planctomycetota bacterium]
MAVKAYLLVNVRIGNVRKIVSSLVELKGVMQAHACWGRPDIFAFVEADNAEALLDFVLNQIQSIEGVESTDTHIVAEL